MEHQNLFAGPPATYLPEDPAAAECAFELEAHCFTPMRSRSAGRNSRHQSRSPRIFV